jgi:hypothetical protein
MNLYDKSKILTAAVIISPVDFLSVGKSSELHDIGYARAAEFIDA